MHLQPTFEPTTPAGACTLRRYLGMASECATQAALDCDRWLADWGDAGSDAGCTFDERVAHPVAPPSPGRLVPTLVLAEHGVLSTSAK